MQMGYTVNLLNFFRWWCWKREIEREREDLIVNLKKCYLYNFCFYFFTFLLRNLFGYFYNNKYINDRQRERWRERCLVVDDMG